MKYDSKSKKVYSSRDFLKEWGVWCRKLSKKEFDQKFS
jgi:hypothetical protein